MADKQQRSYLRPIIAYIIDQVIDKTLILSKLGGGSFIPADLLRNLPLHHATHENGGSDELNVTGLSGELADPQPPKAHEIVDHTATGGSPGDVPTVQADGSLALQAPVGGAIDAADVSYTPSTPTDWAGDADPGDVDAALDQLAERVDDLEGAGATSSVKLSDIETYQRFIITAHRGDINSTDGYPENTLIACLSAAKKGAHRIEVDTRLSSDGTWYLMHDASVDRTTNGSGNVSAKTDAQLDALVIDGGYGYRAAHAGLYPPAKLSDVMTALAPYDVTLQLDNKVAASAGALASFVVAQGWAQRVCINAYTQAEAQAIKAVDSRLAVVGNAAWPETAIVTPNPGITEAQVDSYAPIQIHVLTPVTDYGTSDEAVNAEAAYNAGARGMGTWNLNAALAKWREIATGVGDGIADALADHVAEADPHTQYQLESEKGVANGYAALGADGKVPEAQLPESVGRGELLMQDGVSSPPVPLETEDGTDWLWEG